MIALRAKNGFNRLYSIIVPLKGNGQNDSFKFPLDLKPNPAAPGSSVPKIRDGGGAATSGSTRNGFGRPMVVGGNQSRFGSEITVLQITTVGGRRNPE